MRFVEHVLYNNVADNPILEKFNCSETMQRVPDGFRKTTNIVTVIKIQRLEWLGHDIRMNETRSVKKIFEGKLEGRRGRGRPRLKWIDDLRKLGVKRWRAKALDREEWASIIREVKAKLKGP